MKRALLIGINAYPSQALAGCINDVQDVATYLVGTGEYTSDDIVPLHDSRATKAAIVATLSDLIRLSRPGDSLLVHYSGHGAQIPSQDVDEPDGFDEVLCPVDFDWTQATTLSDTELGAIFDRVEDGVALTFVVDACHSGDLRRPAGLRFLVPPDDVAWRLKNRKRVVRSLRRPSNDNVAIVSACDATETAADSSFGGRPNGAFTYYWLRELNAARGSAATLNELVVRVSAPLVPFKMHPTLSGPAVLLNGPFSSASRGLTPPVAALSLGNAEWRALSAEIVNRAATDRDFKARFEEKAGAVATTLPFLNLMERTLGAGVGGSRSVICRTFFWGFHIEIGHDELESFVGTADTVNAIAATIAPAGGPAAPWIELIAVFVAAGLAGIRALDAGAGIYVSMLWIAPGVFVPTGVPVRGIAATNGAKATVDKKRLLKSTDASNLHQ